MHEFDYHHHHPSSLSPYLFVLLLYILPVKSVDTPSQVGVSVFFFYFTTFYIGEKSEITIYFTF